MKNPLFLTLFFFFMACNTESPSDAEPITITITGHWKNAESEMLYLIRATDRIGYKGYLAVLDTVELDSSGSFSLSFEASTPHFYQVSKDDRLPLTYYPIYLEPGDSLHLDVDRDRESFIQYRGDCAGFYSFYDDLSKKLWKDSLFKARFDQRREMEPADFASFFKDRRDIGKRLLAQYVGQYDNCQPLEEAAQAVLDYSAGDLFFDYLQYHHYYANDTFLYFSADSNFYDLISDISPDAGDYYFLGEYYQFIGGHLTDLFERKHGDLPDSVFYEKSYPLQLEIIQEELEGVASDLAILSITDDFSFGLSRDNFFEQAEAIDAHFSENYNKEENYRKFKRILEEYESLKPGMPAPPLSLPDTAGNMVSLEDFKGKVVYIDFWGTWCYPCLQEMPHSLEMEEEFKGQDVVFLFVALEYDEEDIQRWKDFVMGKNSLSYASFLEQREYPGVHLLAEKQFGNPDIVPYLINYAPSYVLIDKEGKIVKARAPRPSDEKTPELIRELLEQ
jgi:thiol-disulfide isomerase/thioredoxin